MNLIGLLVSIIFILIVIFISSISKRDKELSRKFIHIGVSNWWIIAIIFFDNVLYASAVPFLFIVVNYISYKKDLIKSMERGNSKGAIYYAISCLILTLVSYLVFDSMLYGGIGMFIMGYGDGFAAIIGSKFGGKGLNILGSKKTLLGSISMFLISFLVSSIFVFILGSFNLISILLISVVATVVERYSPFGLDNLTVPLITTYLSYLVL